MKKLITDRTGIALLMFLIPAYAVFKAFDFNVEARLMPLMVGIPTLLLSALVLVMELAAQRPGASRTAEPAAGHAEGHDQQASQGRRELVIIGWLLGLVALIYLVGLLWAVPVFLILSMRLHGQESWKMVLAVAAATWAVVYLLFVSLLNMQLNAGLLGEMLTF